MRRASYPEVQKARHEHSWRIGRDLVGQTTTVLGQGAA